jgi:hypothetical protein
LRTLPFESARAGGRITGTANDSAEKLATAAAVLRRVRLVE